MGVVGIAMVSCIVAMIYRPRIEVVKNTSAVRESDLSRNRFSVFQYSTGDAKSIYSQILIDSNGNAIYTLSDCRDSQSHFFCRRFTCNEEDLLDLLEILQEEGFAELDDQYKEVRNNKTPWSYLCIKTDSKRKLVGWNVSPSKAQRLMARIKADILERYRHEMDLARPISLDKYREIVESSILIEISD